MLDKIIFIKNVGSFRDYNATGDMTLKPLTLLYAENGLGKTTLCSILRSLETKRTDFLTERKTLGATNDPTVKLMFGGAAVSFSAQGWLPVADRNLVFFDSTFIHENVYAGDYVEHDHKKNLYRVIVGMEGVGLARGIEDVDSQSRTNAGLIKAMEQELVHLLPTGTTLAQFLGWQITADLDALILTKKDELARKILITKKTTEIQAKGKLKKITIPEISPDFGTILQMELEGILESAELIVRTQVAKHDMGEYGNAWLSKGIPFVKENACPFCGQPVVENDLLTAYRSFFNEEYKKLKVRVESLHTLIEGTIGELTIASLERESAQNIALLEFWKQFAEMPLPEFPIIGLGEGLARIKVEANRLATLKQQKPIEAVAFDVEFQESLAGLSEIKEQIDSYNAAIDLINAQIDTQKSNASQREDFQALEIELKALEAKKTRFKPDIVSKCVEYTRLLERKSSLAKEKKDLKEELDTYCESIFQTYQNSINKYLDEFNAGFRISNWKHQYMGGTPSTVYQIEINNTSVHLGDSRTQAGTHSFKTTLSSGDRSALALAFFMASVVDDPQIATKVVVLDDPFTSLDMFRRTCTDQLIRQLADKAKQVVLLSHDPFFLKLVYDGHTNVAKKALQLSPTSNGTSIGLLDLDAITQTTYMQNYGTLLAYYRDRTGTRMEVARSIRPFLEGLLRFRYPGHFAPSSWLGDFVVQIRNAAPTDGLAIAQGDLPEIEAINQYSKKYHHDQNTNADSELISDGELHGFVKRTLRLVGGGN